MALADSLQAHIGNSPAPANRVKILLDRLEGTPDHKVLVDALNSQIRNIALTRALRAEYGHDVVTETSVGEYRRSTRQVNGL